MEIEVNGLIAIQRTKTHDKIKKGEINLHMCSGCASYMMADGFLADEVPNLVRIPNAVGIHWPIWDDLSRNATLSYG